ncbi:MAG TPA: FHA domain-containing protein [Usitatibacteraceae bacterium]
MSWFIEHIHRDGTVLARVPVPAAPAPELAVVHIGRALDNDLVLDDPHCAAHHAQLEVGADGTARLIDLGTRNGIVAGRNRRAAMHEISSDEPYRLGQTLIRVRSSAWSLAPERELSQRAMWPLALLGLVLVLGYGAWELWLGDVQEKSPQYLYALSGMAALLCLWSTMYAVFGRLVSGVDRFFSHLVIACSGYLAATLLLNLLDVLAFSMSWLWPVRITQPVIVIVTALTVRQHLRLADPRHWRTLRVGLVIVAVFAIAIPIAQQWVSNKRLTDVQTINVIEHPALRLARPTPMQDFSATAAALKAKVDKARKHEDDDSDGAGIDSDDFE